MEIIIVKDYAEMSQKASDIISDFIQKNPQAKLGLATGETPEGTYKNLINIFTVGGVLH